MLNTRSIEVVDGGVAPFDARPPRYESYCFSRIAPTIEYLLNGVESGGGASAHTEPARLPEDALPGLAPGDVDRVVLMFIDGFAWRYIERYRSTFPVVERLLDHGVVSKLTSMFPSTTTSHVTGIHTGLTPAESGLYEWFQYHEGYDAIIAPLLFSYAGERKRDGLLALDSDPVVLYQGSTLHERLVAGGGTSTCVTPAAFTPSPFNDQVCRGAKGHPYRGLNEALSVLQAHLATPAERPEYLHFYFGDVDAASHLFGLYSPEMEGAVRAILEGLQRWFEALRPASPERTLILITADHGMTETVPERTVYLNRRWPELESRLVRTDRGPLVPAGSPRDFFLHVEPQAETEVCAELEARLEGIATVLPSAALIDAGWFGPPNASASLRRRIGNVAILPHAGECVWWHEPGRFGNPHRALHGGVSAEEMDIPLAAIVV